MKMLVDTIALVYENTGIPDVPKSLEEGGCGLRELVLAYAVCCADALVSTDDFHELLQKGGHLAGDFARALVKRKI